MAELTCVPRWGKHHIAPRAAAIELIATVRLTISLAIAATAVSLGNRSLTRGELIDRGGVPNPADILMDEADQWLLINARFSIRTQ